MGQHHTPKKNQGRRNPCATPILNFKKYWIEGGGLYASEMDNCSVLNEF